MYNLQYSANQRVKSEYFCTGMVHIGKRIQEQAKKMKIGSTELAKLIGTTKQNIHRIYKTKSIDTDQLEVISKMLKFDFFSFYRDEIKSVLTEEPAVQYERSEKSINYRAMVFGGKQVVVIKKAGQFIGQLLHPISINFKDGSKSEFKFIDLIPQRYLRDEEKKNAYRKAKQDGAEEQFRLVFCERIEVKEIIDIISIDEYLGTEGFNMN